MHLVNASPQISFIKTSLCLEGGANYSCLKIFPAVAKSAAFYQFMQERQFVGEKGQALFQQQYQLITAQLQHEEYDDNVLNQLPAALVLMAPFMDREQTFIKLMTQVTKLDISRGLIQLENVDMNIKLVRLWFPCALAEVSCSLLLHLLLPPSFPPCSSLPTPLSPFLHPLHFPGGM